MILIYDTFNNYFKYPRWPERIITNKTNEVNKSIKPTIRDPNATKVEGIEKKRDSLNIAITTPE